MISNAKESHQYHVDHTNRIEAWDDIRNGDVQASSKDNFVDEIDAHSKRTDDMLPLRDEIMDRT